MQSNVPNAIAQLDDVRWKLAQSLKMMSEALEMVLRIQLDHPFKSPLSDEPLPDQGYIKGVVIDVGMEKKQGLPMQHCICAIAPTNICPVHNAPGVR